MSPRKEFPVCRIGTIRNPRAEYGQVLLRTIILYPDKRASDVRPHPRTELVFTVNDSILIPVLLVPHTCHTGVVGSAGWKRDLLSVT